MEDNKYTVLGNFSAHDNPWFKVPVLLLKKQYLLGHSFKFDPRSLCNISKCSMWLLKDMPITNMAFEYTRHDLPRQIF